MTFPYILILVFIGNPIIISYHADKAACITAGRTALMDSIELAFTDDRKTNIREVREFPVAPRGAGPSVYCIKHHIKEQQKAEP